MPSNKNALIRYRTIDRCLQNRARRWTLDDLMAACSDALYEFEGKHSDVSRRTLQLDLQLMRGDKLGYEAPIEVHERKYYRYADPAYTITDVPLTAGDLDVLSESVQMLRQFKDFSLFTDLNGIIQKLEDKVHRAGGQTAAVIHLDRNERLKGLEFLDALYQAIRRRRVLCVDYRSFRARAAQDLLLHPYILKEFNNRWFVVGRRHESQQLLTLALDRIKAVSEHPALAYQQTDFDPDTYYRNTHGVTVLDQPPIDITLWVAADTAPYVLTKPFHHSQRTLEELADGSVVVAFTVHHNFEVERAILGFGQHVRVLGPRQVRRRIHKALRTALDRYGEDDPRGAQAN